MFAGFSKKPNVPPRVSATAKANRIEKNSVGDRLITN
jgi:hypothetical protein